MARGSFGEPELRIFGSPERGLAPKSFGGPESCIFGSQELKLVLGQLR